MVENHVDHNMNHGNNENTPHAMGHSMVRFDGTKEIYINALNRHSTIGFRSPFSTVVGKSQILVP